MTNSDNPPLDPALKLLKKHISWHFPDDSGTFSPSSSKQAQTFTGLLKTLSQKHTPPGKRTTKRTLLSIHYIIRNLGLSATITYALATEDITANGFWEQARAFVIACKGVVWRVSAVLQWAYVVGFERADGKDGQSRRRGLRSSDFRFARMEIERGIGIGSARNTNQTATWLSSTSISTSNSAPLPRRSDPTFKTLVLREEYFDKDAEVEYDTKWIRLVRPDLTPEQLFNGLVMFEETAEVGECVDHLYVKSDLFFGGGDTDTREQSSSIPFPLSSPSSSASPEPAPVSSASSSASESSLAVSASYASSSWDCPSFKRGERSLDGIEIEDEIYT